MDVNIRNTEEDFAEGVMVIARMMLDAQEEDVT